MADIYKGELQDYQGNTMYPHSKADVIFCEDGTSVEEKLKNGIPQGLESVTGKTDDPSKNDTNVLASSKALNALKTELETSFSAGCNLIAGKITSLGVPTAGNASPTTISDNIETLAENKYNDGINYGATYYKVGTANPENVLEGTTFTNSSESGLEGTMPNKGGINHTLGVGSSFTIPRGFHNGNGKITNAVANKGTLRLGPTNGTAVDITDGYYTNVDTTAVYNAGYNAKRFKLNQLKLSSKGSVEENGSNAYAIFDTTGYNRMKIGAVKFYEYKDIEFAVWYNDKASCKLAISNGYIADMDNNVCTMEGSSYVFDITSASNLSLYMVILENGYGTCDLTNVEFYNE